MFAIDVECVATGTDHNTRSVAQIAIVNEHMEVVMVSGLWCWACRALQRTRVRPGV